MKMMIDDDNVGDAVVPDDEDDDGDDDGEDDGDTDVPDDEDDVAAVAQPSRTAAASLLNNWLLSNPSYTL